MNDDFWLAKWRKGQLGFHQNDFNQALVRYGDHFAQPSRVFVPLAGKTKDMVWLLDRGHEVVAVELAEDALVAFFEENGQSFTRRDDGVLLGERIEAWPRNLFELSTDQLGNFDGIFDRAALVAVEPSKRSTYADQLRDLLKVGGKLLLVTFDYDQSKMDGPPFAVTSDIVHELFDGLSITCLEERSIYHPDHKFAQRGLDWLNESAWLIT